MLSHAKSQRSHSNNIQEKTNINFTATININFTKINTRFELNKNFQEKTEQAQL